MVVDRNQRPEYWPQIVGLFLQELSQRGTLSIETAIFHWFSLEALILMKSPPKKRPLPNL